MVKVIVGYKMKNGADIQPMLLKLRQHAMTYAGFIGAENLRSEGDSSVIAMLQTWEQIDDWRVWETSKIRQSILKEAKPFFLEEPRITVYTVMSTTGWG
jgi:quinol monooxygenase YgiN